MFLCFVPTQVLAIEQASEQILLELLAAAWFYVVRGERAETTVKSVICYK